MSRSTHGNDDSPSQYSDDQDLETYAMAVAEFKLSWQKQKRENERRFLKTAHAELDRHVDRKQEEIKGIMNDMEKTYQEFLEKYAAIEDKMRDVLVKIVEAQKPLVALSVRKHQETVELASNLEEGQLEAIKQIKQTCKDFEAMTDAFMKA